MAIVESHYPGQEYFDKLTPLSPHERIIWYTTIMTDCMQPSGIMPESLEGQQILDRLTMIYADKVSHGFTPTPHVCFMEAAWDVLSNGERKLDINTVTSPNVFVSNRFTSEEREVAYTTPGSKYILTECFGDVDHIPVMRFSVRKAGHGEVGLRLIPPGYKFIQVLNKPLITFREHTLTLTHAFDKDLSRRDGTYPLSEFVDTAQVLTAQDVLNLPTVTPDTAA